MTTLVEYIGQQENIAIPQCFIQQFVYNYEHRNEWTRSDVLYDQCYKDAYARYDNFTRELRRHLGDQDIQQSPPNLEEQRTGRGQSRKVFLISSQGVKRMGMVGNAKVRDYYIQLESSCFDFVDHQREESKRQIAELEHQIAHGNDDRPASVYQIKVGDQLLYIGKDQSIAQNRVQQHLKERRKIVQQYQLIDIVLATMPEQDIQILSQPCHFDTATDLEKSLIETLNPKCNQALAQREYRCTHCPRVYAQRGWLERHVADKHNQ